MKAAHPCLAVRTTAGGSIASGLMAGILMLAWACSSGPSQADVADLRRKAANATPPEKHSVVVEMKTAHDGPGVASGDGGPARFARTVLDAFSSERAMQTVAFADRFYREPGNEGFEAVLDHLAAALKEAGFGAEEGFELEFIETPMQRPAWTPRRARLALAVPGAADLVLHTFEKSEDRDRTMLPRNAPSAKVEGDVVFQVDDLAPGAILVTDKSLTSGLLRRAKERGAVAAFSSSLQKYNVDPSGAERHLDAVQYRSVDPTCPLPVAQISPRTYATLQEAVKSRASAHLNFECEVDFHERRLRTLVATVVGAKSPDRAVVIAGHVQEPGACDNASGLSTLLEGARVLAAAIRENRIERPAKSIAFVWGNENEESRIWLEHAKSTAIAGISADMTGESKEKTGAIALLERLPDPGAVRALPPDKHTPWGSTPVSKDRLKPNGLALIARCALLDVGALEPGWPTSEHPYEGGSDHDEYLKKDIPAILFWHFTDFAYHTSLDRLDHVDPAELRRTGAAILSCALAVADARPADLDRYLSSLKLEQTLRTAACEKAGDAELAQSWREWSKGARMWLRDLCLGPEAETSPLAHDAPAEPKPAEPKKEEP